MKLPDFEGWAIFATVADARSFTGAAAALGVSKSTVSKAVARLEGRLGAILFHRTSRTLSLTEAGRRLLPHALRMVAEAAEAEDAAADETGAPSGLIRLAAPMSFGVERVAPAIADFLALHPGLSVELALSDATVDLVAEGYDAALRIGTLPDSSLRARRLCAITLHIVAAPRYLAERGVPDHPRDLAHHDVVDYANARTPGLWRLVGPGGESVSIRPPARLTTGSGDAMLPALCAGLGLGLLPDFIVGPDLRAGRLVPVLADWHAPAVALHLVTPPGRQRSARVELLVGFLVSRFGENAGNQS